MGTNEDNGGLLFGARTKIQDKNKGVVLEDGKRVMESYPDIDFSLFLMKDEDKYVSHLGKLTAHPRGGVTYFDGDVWTCGDYGAKRFGAKKIQTKMSVQSFLTLEGKLLALSQNNGLWDICTSEPYITPEQMSEAVEREGLSFISEACVHNGEIVVIGGYTKKEIYGYTIDFFNIKQGKNNQWELKHICCHPHTKRVAKPYCGSDATPDHSANVCSMGGHLYSTTGWCDPITVQQNPRGEILSRIEYCRNSYGACISGMTCDESQQKLYLRVCDSPEFVTVLRIPQELKPRINFRMGGEGMPDIINLIPIKSGYIGYSILENTMCRVSQEEVKSILQKYEMVPY